MEKGGAFSRILRAAREVGKMKWISVAVAPASGDDVKIGNYYAVWCVSEFGELWCYTPHNKKWMQVDPPEVL